MIPKLSMSTKDLVNFIMVSGTDIVFVDGARGSGKTTLVRFLEKELPDSVVYKPLGNKKARCKIDKATGSVIGGDAGLDVGQAYLGALDFLEQVPYEGTVIFERSPISQLVFRPGKDATAEVAGWMERINRAQLRCTFLLTCRAGGDCKQEQLVEQKAYMDAVRMALWTDCPAMHILEVYTELVSPQEGLRTYVMPTVISQRWQYR